MNHQKVKDLAEGGFGRVELWKAEDGTPYCIKRLKHQSAGTLSSMQREVGVMRHLEHEHIAPVIGWNLKDNPPWFAMPYYRNGSLRKILSKAPSNRVNPKHAVTFMHKISKAMVYAHERSVVHRDLKPENILVSDEMAPVIADWGIGRLVEEGEIMRTIAYTRQYVAPELRTGRYDQRVDIYSAGIVFVEMVTGRPDRSAIPQMPAELQPIAKRMTAENPDHRYESFEKCQFDLWDYDEDTFLGWLQSCFR